MLVFYKSSKMDDKKQNIDSKEHLLDALDGSGSTNENLKELLSNPDNIQDIRLLQDCRKCFIREDFSLGGEPEVAWENFLHKRKKIVKAHCVAYWCPLLVQLLVWHWCGVD